MQPRTLPRRSRSARVPAVLALSAGLLLTGCSQGPDAFNENFPADDPVAEPREVIRTPVVPQGVQDVPLVVPLPGPTGGVPGNPPDVFPQATPGEGQEGAVTDEQ